MEFRNYFDSFVEFMDNHARRINDKNALLEMVITKSPVQPAPYEHMKRRALGVDEGNLVGSYNKDPTLDGLIFDVFVQYTGINPRDSLTAIDQWVLHVHGEYKEGYGFQVGFPRREAPFDAKKRPAVAIMRSILATSDDVLLVDAVREEGLVDYWHVIRSGN